MTWKVGDVRIFRWASSLSGSPGFLVLVALGWTIEAVDERYFSVLMSRDDSERTPSSMEAA
jgi:hypothetical protein